MRTKKDLIHEVEILKYEVQSLKIRYDGAQDLLDNILVIYPELGIDDLSSEQPTRFDAIASFAGWITQSVASKFKVKEIKAVADSITEAKDAYEHKKKVKHAFDSLGLDKKNR